MNAIQKRQSDFPAKMNKPLQCRRISISSKMLLALIMILGAWLRLEAALETVVDHPIRADAADYVAYAYNLNHSFIYSRTPPTGLDNGAATPTPDALRPPGFPIFLSMILAQDIPDWDFIRDVMLAHAIIGTLTVWLTFLVSRSLMPASWALLPTLLVAICPKLIISGTFLLSETLFTAFLVISIYWLTRKPRGLNTCIIALIGGLLLGTTALIRPTLQYVLPFVLLAVLPCLPSREKWKYAIGICLGFLLAAAPWAIRNAIATGSASDSTLTISTLIHGHYPDMMFNSQGKTLGYPYRFDPKISEISASIPAAINGITERMLQSPRKYISWYLIGKPLAFFSWPDPAATQEIFTYPTIKSPYFQDPIFALTMIFMKLTHWLWILLAAMTATLALSKNSQRSRSAPIHSARIMAFVIIYFTLVHIAGFPISRYSTPLLPFIYILAIYGIFNFRGTLISHYDQSMTDASHQKGPALTIT